MANKMKKIDLSSFKLKDNLSPDIWKERKLSMAVSLRLKQIAHNFMNSLGFSRDSIKDIIFTGSLANYNWSKYSDIDLHIILDFSEINNDAELVKQLLDSKRGEWNERHNIKIRDSEVEIYLQDINEEHHSSGIYSIMNDKWILFPKKTAATFDGDDIEKKAFNMMREIERVREFYSQGEYSQALTYAEKLKSRIKTFRKCGLEDGGEFSNENIAFKAVRRNGYLSKLSALKDASFDRLMSLDEGIGVASGTGGLLGGWVADDPSGWFQIRNSVIEDFPGAEVSANFHDEDRVLEIFAIFAPNEMRGQHIGSEILERVTDWADAQQAKIIITPSTKFPESLQIFYKKHGFVVNADGNKNFSLNGIMYRKPQ